MKGLRFKNIIFILLGAAIFAFGLVNFNMQNNLAEGGFTGITLLLFFLFNIDPSYSNLVLNIPLFFVGWKLLGRTAFIYTMLGVVSLSLFLWIFQRFPVNMPLRHDMTLAVFLPVFLLEWVLALFSGLEEQQEESISSHVLFKNISGGIWEKRCFFLTLL